jgi:DNA helicase-2/ATP-dependent DNA helicase PcrA
VTVTDQEGRASFIDDTHSRESEATKIERCVEFSIRPTSPFQAGRRAPESSYGTLYRVESWLSRLDEKQREAATAGQVPLVIVAGAGSGKTSTLVARIAYMSSQGWVKPEEILAVTHTTKAAGEMRERLSKLDKSLEKVSCHTIHAAAWRVYQQFWRETGGDRERTLLKNNFGLVKESYLTSQRQMSVENEEVSDLLSEIEIARASLQTSDTYASWAQSRKRQTTMTYRVIAETWGEYNRAKNRHNAMDFADVLEEACRIIETTPAGEKIRAKWKAVVVDEYQDTDLLQEKLLKAIRNNRKLVTVVGDPRQTIYSFKGAKREVLEKAMKERGAKVVRLDTSWRCATKIVELANKVIGKNYGTGLVAARDGGSWKVSIEADEASEGDAICSQLSEWRRAGFQYHEMGVLYRFNSQEGKIEAILARDGIPYQKPGGESFLKRPEVLAVLKPFGAMARAHPDDNARETLDICARETGFDPDRPPSGAGAVRMRWENVNALLEMTEEHECSGEALDRMLEMARENHQQGVHISTVHGAKGLEYKCVLVAGIMEGQFPSVYATDMEDIEEERRLLYVAITRAIENLTMTGALKRGKRTSKPSRHLPSEVANTTKAGEKREQAVRHVSKEIEDLFNCQVCSKRLTGLPARLSKRCSGWCLTGEEKKRWEKAVAWRSQEAVKDGVPESKIASDSGLFKYVLTGESGAGMYKTPTIHF